MSRYRLLPAAEQEAALADHCRHARYVWNLAVEQQLRWQPGRRARGYNEQCAQLTAARAEYDWLAAGSQTLQQQALRDFAQAMRNEAYDVRAMTLSARGTVAQPGVRVAQKRGLNRAISLSCWGLLASPLQHKAFGRVEQIAAAYTSQRCCACGHVALENRKSQAVFECEACTAGPCNADVNAARNIAAGRAVTARGDLGASRSANREPQLCSPAA